MENINVKKRMLEFSRLSHITKTELASQSGLTAAVFMGDNLKFHLSSDKIQSFLAQNPNVSAEWLMRGEGPMLRRSTDGVINGDVNNHAENNSSASITLNMERQNAELLKSKDDIITAQRELIDSLRSQIRMLERSCSENYRQVNYMSEPQTTEYNKIGTTTEQNK